MALPSVRISMAGGAALAIDNAYTAKVGDSLGADTTNGSWTLRTPRTPVEQDFFKVADLLDTWATHALLIDPTPQLIQLDDGTQLTLLTADVSTSLGFVFLAGVWRIRSALALFPGNS